MGRLRYGIISLLGAMLLGLGSAWAQQTVFNVPSADVTPEGVLFLQHESQFRPYKPRQFWIGTHYSALGIGHNTELTMTLFDLNAPFTRSMDLGIGFKNVHPILTKRFPAREFKTVLGSQVVPSLDGGVGNWTYASVSGRVPKLKTRLTAGVNYGTKHIFGKTTIGAIGAVEQPITKKLSLIMDWYSGDSAYGLLIPGVGIQPTDSIQIFAGYQIPNPSNKLLPSGFVIEVAKFFR